MTQFNVSLWGDEAWAATLAVKPYLQIIKIVARDTSPPLYYLCLHTWMKIFGTSEIAIRSLSFLFFLGTIITVYLIGKQLWNQKTGFLATLLTFFNPFLFKYAFEGRMYAILLFTSTLSIYFFLKKQKLGFILATTAALYSHHFSVFVIFWEFLWRLSENRDKLFKKTGFKLLITNYLITFSDFLIIALFYLPWLYPLYYQTSLVQSGFWLGKPTLRVFLETIGKFLAGEGKETARQIAWTAIIFALILKKWLQDKEKTIFLLGWAFSPLLATYLISQFLQPIFFDRYLLATIPALCLLVVSLPRKLSWVLIATTIFCLASLNWHYFTRPTKRPFRDLANFIKKEAPELTLINHNAAAHHLWESKYYGLKVPIYSPQPLAFYVGTALMEPDDVIQSLPDKGELGLISSAPVEEIQIPGYGIVKEKRFGDLSFLWLKRD